jgi:hypothetical protein
MNDQEQRRADLVKAARKAGLNEAAAGKVADKLVSATGGRDELLEIVQAFAADEPRDGEFGYCIYCSAHDAGEKHDADCVWVQAQKWENK